MYAHACGVFLSTPSARRATTATIHAQTVEVFLSTPSARRATHEGLQNGRRQIISIHALREEGDPLGIGTISPIELISIHALREEGDPLGIGTSSPIELISIHALREEGDRSRTSRSTSQKRFLSTPSARRATVCWLYIRFVSKNFYPRPPRGGRPGQRGRL